MQLQRAEQGIQQRDRKIAELTVLLQQQTGRSATETDLMADMQALLAERDRRCLPGEAP